MFSEMFHGLLTRAHRDNGIDHPPPGTSLKTHDLRIGIIPSGAYHHDYRCSCSIGVVK